MVLGTVVVATSVFLVRVRSYVGAGDAPETVAAARVVGVVHSPGYPLETILAAGFGRVPIGSFALRVNLLSVACAALGLFALACLTRRLVTERAAVVGLGLVGASPALLHAAGYAKHDALDFLSVSALLYFTTQARKGGTRCWVGIGLATGALLASGWYLVPAMLPGIVVLAGRPRWRQAAASLVSLVTVVVVLYALLVVRAHSDPAVNWGSATSLHRLSDLVGMKDVGAGAPSTSFGALPASASLLHRAGAYGLMLTREMTPVGIALTLVGIAAAWRRSQRALAVGMPLVVLGNLAVLAYRIGPGSADYASDLIHAGFLWPALAGSGILAVVGLDDGAARVASWRSSMAVGEARRSSLRSRWSRTAAIAIGATSCSVAYALHLSPAAPPSFDFAGRYARDLTAELPPRSVFVVWGAERAFPLLALQTVEHRRRDIDVVYGDGLATAWYREQLAKKLGIRIDAGPSAHDVAATLIYSLGGLRPVSLDAAAAAVVGDAVGFRQRALTFGVDESPRTGPLGDPDIVLLARRGTEASSPNDRNHWPQRHVSDCYVGALAAGAITLASHGDMVRARDIASLARRIDPEDPAARAAVAATGSA